MSYRLWFGLCEKKNEVLKKALIKRKQALDIAVNALKEAAEWHQKDDVNGEAGYIAWKALKELEQMK